MPELHRSITRPPEKAIGGWYRFSEGTMNRGERSWTIDEVLERGVRLTDTDGWSWGAPFVFTARKYAETKDASLIWEGHKAGRHVGYCHLEKLHDLDKLPSTAFTVSCFPVKIEHASAGWTRAVAIIDS
jgi:kynurenine formamidase